MRRLNVFLLLLVTGLLLVAWVRIPSQTGDVCMMYSTLPVDGTIAQTVLAVLRNAPALPADVDCFTISNVSEISSGKYLVSVAGLQLDDLQTWTIQDNAVWFGMIAVKQDLLGNVYGAMRGDPAWEEIIESYPLDSRVRDELSGGVVDESMIFYFGFMSQGTIAAGAGLVFKHPRARLCCRSCGQVYTPEKMDFHCPSCGEQQGDIVGGRELYVESLEII